MNIGNRNQIQGNVNNSTGQRLYHELENLIFDNTGVSATVVVKNGCISIRTATIADYYVAKAEIKGRTSKTIVRDLVDLELVK